MVKFIKPKSDAVEAVKDMMIVFENLCRTSTKLLSLKSGFCVKQLRSDGGKEYTGKSSLNWLQRRGTVNETTVPYSPKSNGKAGRLK